MKTAFAAFLLSCTLTISLNAWAGEAIWKLTDSLNKKVAQTTNTIRYATASYMTEDHERVVRIQISKAKEKLHLLQKEKDQLLATASPLRNTFSKRTDRSRGKFSDLMTLSNLERDIALKNTEIAQIQADIEKLEQPIATISPEIHSKIAIEVQENLNSLLSLHKQGLFPDLGPAVGQKQNQKLELALLGRQAAMLLNDLKSAELNDHARTEIGKKLALNYLSLLYFYKTEIQSAAAYRSDASPKIIPALTAVSIFVSVYVLTGLEPVHSLDRFVSAIGLATMGAFAAFWVEYELISKSSRNVSFDTKVANSNFIQRIRAEFALAKITKQYLAELKGHLGKGSPSDQLENLRQIIDTNTKVVTSIEETSKCELALIDPTPVGAIESAPNISRFKIK